MRVQSKNLLKSKVLILERLYEDKLNGPGRLCMQLPYSWLNSFAKKNHVSTTDRDDFEIPTARLLHFVRTQNQSASKHGWHTFLYSAMRELVCNGQV